MADTQANDRREEEQKNNVTEVETIILVDAEGNEQEYEPLATMRTEEGDFVALLPVYVKTIDFQLHTSLATTISKMENNYKLAIPVYGEGYEIYKVYEHEGEQMFEIVDDDDLFNQLANIFDSVFEQYNGEEEDDIETEFESEDEDQDDDIGYYEFRC